MPQKGWLGGALPAPSPSSLSCLKVPRIRLLLERPVQALSQTTSCTVYTKRECARGRGGEGEREHMNKIDTEEGSGFGDRSVGFGEVEEG